MSNTPTIGSNNKVEVHNYQHYGSNTFGENDRYVPIAATYSAAGGFDYNIAAAVLPTSLDHRKVFSNLISQMQSEGDFLSNSQIVRLLSNLTSLFRSRFRSNRSIGRLATIHDGYGPLSFVKLLTDARLFGSYFNSSSIQINSAEHLSESYELILASCLKAFSSFGLQYLSSRGNIESIIDESNVSSDLLASLVSEELTTNAILNSIHHITRHLADSAKLYYTDFFKIESKKEESKVNAAVVRGTEAIDRIFNIIAESSRLVIEESVYGSTAVGDARFDTNRIAVDEAVTFLQENDSLSLVFKNGFYCLTSLAGSMNLADMNYLNAVSNKNDLANSELGVLINFLRSNSLLNGAEFSFEDPSDVIKAIKQKNTNTSSPSDKVVANLLYSVSKFNENSKDAEGDVYGKMKKKPMQAAVELFFSFDGKANVFRSNTKDIKYVKRVNDVLKLVQVTYESKTGQNAADAQVKKLTYLDSLFNSLSGVKESEFLTTLQSLSDRVDNLLKYRAKLMEHYQNAGKSSTSDSSKLAAVISAFADLCTDSMDANDVEVTNNINNFLNSEIWNSSDASILFAAAMTPNKSSGDVADVIRNYVFDISSLQAFNKSALGDIVTVSSSSEDIAGFEFSQGSVLEIQLATVTELKTSNSTLESLNGVKDLSDLFGHLMQSDKGRKAYSKRMNLYYNARLNSAIVQSQILDDIFKGNVNQLTSPFTFSVDFKNKFTTKIGQIATALAYNLALYKSSLYSSVAHYLLSFDDILYTVEKGIEFSRINYIANFSSDEVLNFVKQERDNIKVIVSQLGILEAIEAISKEREGFPLIVTDGQTDFQYTLDRLMSIFGEKATRKSLSDYIKTIGSLCAKISSSSSDIRNFKDVIDINESSYREAMGKMSNIHTRDEKLNIDMLAIYEPNNVATDLINRTTDRTMVSAHFLYGLDLNKLVAASYSEKSYDKRMFDVTDIVLPVGLDPKKNVAPHTLIDLVSSQLDARFNEKTVNKEAASSRLERIVITEGSTLAAMFQYAISGNELVRYGLYGLPVSKTAYTDDGILNSILEEAGLHGDQRLADYEVHSILAYVRTMSKYNGFPLQLTKVGKEFFDSGLYLQSGYKEFKEGVSTSTDNVMFLSRKITSLKLKDLVTYSNSVTNKMGDGLNPIVAINFYMRPEESLSLLNSDIVIYKSHHPPKLTKVTPGSGSSPFYIENNSIMFVEGEISIEPKRLISELQARNTIVDAAKAILSVIDNKV